MQRQILRQELIGIGVIAGVGSVMHFAFEWSGELPVIGVFAAVNESVWEHLKLTYWPTLLYAAIEYHKLRDLTQNCIAAKTASLYIMPAVIAGLYYAYVNATGSDSLIFDIATFVIAIAVGQLVSARIMARPRYHQAVFVLAIIGMVTLGVLYGVFTFRTPQLPIFREGSTGIYGIP